MAKPIDISNWVSQEYYSTKGSRNKSVVISPEGISYYFKTSLLKPGKDYKYEFWSEIISSEVGAMLGLKVLKYEVATKRDLIGCLSQFMNQPEMEMLNEGVQYLQGFDPDFAPDNSKGGKAYTFQLIVNSLERFDLSMFINDIIDMIIFDSIIGNGDRHQENWAFISKHGRVSKTYVEMVRYIKTALTDQEIWRSLPRYVKWVIHWFYRKGTTQQLRDEVVYARMKWNSGILFSELYDNGSSLGRELSEEAIKSHMEDFGKLSKYIENGKPEIHWNGEKLNHFELLSRIVDSYPDRRTRCLGLCAKYDESRMISFIDSVDAEIPNEFADSALSEIRKRFIVKTLSLRVKRLQDLFNG